MSYALCCIKLVCLLKLVEQLRNTEADIETKETPAASASVAPAAATTGSASAATPAVNAAASAAAAKTLPAAAGKGLPATLKRKKGKQAAGEAPPDGQHTEKDEEEEETPAKKRDAAQKAVLQFNVKEANKTKASLKKALQQSSELLGQFESNPAYAWGKSDHVAGKLCQQREALVNLQNDFAKEFMLQETSYFKSKYGTKIHHNQSLDFNNEPPPFRNQVVIYLQKHDRILGHSPASESTFLRKYTEFK